VLCVVIIWHELFAAAYITLLIASRTIYIFSRLVIQCEATSERAAQLYLYTSFAQTLQEQRAELL